MTVHPMTVHPKIAEFLNKIPNERRGGLSGKYYVYVLMRPDGSVFYVVFPGPLADAFEQAARDYAEEQRALGNTVYGTGIRAYMEHILEERPEIEDLIKKGITGFKIDP